MSDNNEATWEQLAYEHWQKPITRADPDFIKTRLWTPLEADSFSARSLIVLEDLQIVEKYLWPTFSENSSNQHVLLLATFVDFKRQRNLQSWSVFASRPDDYSTLFHRILSITIDVSLPTKSRLIALNFVVGAFQSLEQEFIRKECAPLVSIATWHNLHSEELRSKEVDKSIARRKAWRASAKKYESANSEAQIRLRFERAWLFSVTLDFLRKISTGKSASSDEIIYCERFLELLIDLLSQLPTRRYVNTLLKDLNVLALLRTSQMYQKDENSLFQDLTDSFQHFSEFASDDSDGQNQDSTFDLHYQRLAQLQKTALQHFEHKLKVFGLSNLASIDKEHELRSQLAILSDVELERLCQLQGLRTSYPPSAGLTTGREVFIESLIVVYARPKNVQEVIQQLSVLPTDETLYDSTLLRNETYDGSRPLALPKLNLQYLTLGDFMLRSFQLYQSEAFYEIRKDMEATARRLKPRLARDMKTILFDGSSKMALPIDKPALIEAAPPKVASAVPSLVRAEVMLDLGKVNERTRHEWDNLRPKDVVFLLSVRGIDSGSNMLTNGNSLDEAGNTESLVRVRAAEVYQIQDDKGKPLRDIQTTNGFGTRSRTRRLLLDLDPVAFQADKDRLSAGKGDVYASMNVIVRRSGRENNFRPVLSTIQQLVGSQTNLPSWLQEVFLGYGDPRSASFPLLAHGVEKIDYIDTFLDWQHLQESFPGKMISPSDQAIDPPYVLEGIGSNSKSVVNNSKKRRRDQMENDEISIQAIHVATYKPTNTGPYPIDVPKKNTVRFTPKQVEAIVSGTQPGLSVVVGPPGTGKTDVATQIINLLYHNFPSERILLVAHSNQALNQLFQKIIALDIDSRHLLRLGHGEEDLETQSSYSKFGRVESFMENRQNLLNQVSRLAQSINAEGAHGNTCETADYFHQVFIKPAWTKFFSTAEASAASPGSISAAFPFHKFFANAPIPDLFPPDGSLDDILEIASGCRNHLNKVFSELEAIRPFEILRHSRDQANHLLVKEARIIAMTSTHAAIRRSEIAELGFHYDTLIMEEAAQITEIESFIPCAMQKPDPKTGELPLKRVVLVGDHLQNSPVIQNLALRQYANFEQSLFLRLVRLGVPTIQLDQQGRCRPSIAHLFSWRYESLTNLPHLLDHPEFMRANAGFRYDFQFINIDDYQGQGEREPTPHFIQNLGEAEYAVALYQYMRLLGYPAHSISVLATYAGQKALIRDVLEHRCKGNRLFGMPRIVTTVDKYQGEQNDYVILSLVRTKSVGYLRDVRRLTVALSRARLGLYVLGRRDLFEGCKEMEVAMQRLTSRGGSNLEIVAGEMFPSSRNLHDDVSGVEMEGLEHLGQYVYEMTQAKVKSLGGNIQLENGGIEGEGVLAAEGDGQDIGGEMEEDPLHENV